MYQFYKNFFTALVLVFFLTLSLQAQLYVDESISAEQMVSDFFDGYCVEVVSVTTDNALTSFGYFDASQTNMGLNAGIFLSTGSIAEAAQANTSGSTSMVNGTPGDDDLEPLIGMQTYDATALNISLVAENDFLEFEYVFASEEYPEFVGSAFNDAFAFFISGPGIDGMVNIATIPGNDALPVAINNVNADYNSNLFVDNLASDDISFDGMTVPIPASISVIPGETYQVKIVVTDVADSAFDSGVFLSVTSLCGDEDVPLIADFEVNQQEDDFVAFKNNSLYGTSYSWDFGDNNYSNEKEPNHTYAADGEYDVELTVTNYCCTDVYMQTVTVGEPLSLGNIDELSPAIYPNPTTDGIIHLNLSQSTVVHVFNHTGMEIWSGEKESQSTLDLNNFGTGIFLIRIETAQGSYTEKVVSR